MVYININTNECSHIEKEIVMAKEDKLRALDAALSSIERSFGKGAVMKLGDPDAAMNVETVPTG